MRELPNEGSPRTKSSVGRDLVTLLGKVRAVSITLPLERIEAL